MKTSVLLIDKDLAKKKNEILFVKMNSDGFDLGAQRRPNNQNDIPEIINITKAFKNGKEISENALVTLASKEKIAEQDYILVGERYKEVVAVNSHYPMVELGEICEIVRGTSITQKDLIEGNIPVIAGGQQPAYYHNKSNRQGKTITVSGSGAYAGFVNYFEDPIFASDCSTIQTDNLNVSIIYIYYILKSNQEKIYGLQSGMGQPHIYAKDLKQFKIPLPPLSVQKEIVSVIENYQKIIDGAKQITETYMPTIKIDPKWEMVRLGDVCEVLNGYAFKSQLYCKYGIQIVKMGNVQRGRLELNKNISYYPEDFIYELKKYLLENGDILISMTGTQGKEDFGNVCMVNVDRKLFLNQRVGKLNVKSINIDRMFLYLILQMDIFRKQIFQNASGVRQGNISKNDLEGFSIPLPPLKIQQQVVAQINEEIAIVEQNKRLIEIFEQKIKDKINEVWDQKNQAKNVISFPKTESELKFAARNCSNNFIKAVDEQKDGDSDE